MNKIILVSITLLIFIIGVSCASAAGVSQSADSHLKVKDYQGSVKKVSSSVATKKIAKKTTKKLTNKTSKKATSKSVLSKKASQKVNKVQNGWNPVKHEVSCKKMGKGLYKITYDDGYFRIVNSNGKILSYGY